MICFHKNKYRALAGSLALAFTLSLGMTALADTAGPGSQPAGPGAVRTEKTADEAADWARAAGYAVFPAPAAQATTPGPGMGTSQAAAGPGGAEGNQQTAQTAADNAGAAQQDIQQNTAAAPEQTQAAPAETSPGIQTATPGPDSAAQNPAPEAQAQPEQPAQTSQAAAQGQAYIEGNILYSNGRAIDLTKPMIALTYDDGPQTNAGNRIMNAFRQYGQSCTFFMVGDRVPSRAEEVQRMVREGFEVANHTYSHTYLNKVDAATIRKQVTACNDIIEQTCGVRPTIMRLPGGNKNATVLQNVNMPIILWNVDTRDWDHRNAQKTINAVLGKVKNGDIVLMHELYDATATATETLVPTLVSQGFQLVTVSEMAMAKGIQLVPNQVYYSF